jgi:adenine-specific DNA-methyltransferase
MSDNITSPGASSYDDTFVFEGQPFRPGGNLHWKTNLVGMERLKKAGRIFRAENSLRYCKLPEDARALPMKNIWTDTTVGSFAEDKVLLCKQH